RKADVPVRVKSISRYARRRSSVDSQLIVSNRFLIVPLLSSAARMPLPGATIARAMSLSAVIVVPLFLFPFDRARRLRRDVVRDAVHARHFIDDARRDALEHLVRQ